MAIEVNINAQKENFNLNIQFHGTSNRIGILGASGSGKSMTLKSIAGIELPDKGVIQIDDKILFDSSKKINLKPQKRNIGYLFQNYALFPTMTVFKNIESGLKGSRAEKQKRVLEMVEKFKLSGLESRLPSELSGGQQQRVALARIMAYKPEAILLDEPFSALDIFLKDQLQQELTEMLKSYQGTVIMVSHNRDEIYRFSQELLIVDNGTTVIYGKTKEIFSNPRYKEAARLTGCKNFSDIKKIDSHTIEVLDWKTVLHLKEPVPDYASCIGYRAHDFIPIWGKKQENCFQCIVVNMAELPFETNYYLLPQDKGETERLVCWFVQRDKLPEIKQKGIPDYLKIQEEKIMFLEKNGG